MAIKVLKVEAHWNYLLSIENDLEKLSRYIEIDMRNFNCFSIEISRILMTAAAEVDVVCKQICKNLNPDSQADNIHQYRDEILLTHKDIPDFEVSMYRYGLTLVPWSNWKNNNGVPLWWTAYNKIKHQRDLEFHQGNLKNVLNSIAGLFVMVLYLYKRKAEMGELVPSTQMLRVTEEHYDGNTFWDFETGINYKL